MIPRKCMAVGIKQSRLQTDAWTWSTPQAAWDTFRGGDGERSLAQAGKYAAACKRVATELECCCLDLFDQMSQIPRWEEMMADGLHFNAHGNAKVHELLMAEIEKSLPHLSVSHRPALTE